MFELLCRRLLVHHLSRQHIRSYGTSGYHQGNQIRKRAVTRSNWAATYANIKTGSNLRHIRAYTRSLAETAEVGITEQPMEVMTSFMALLNFKWVPQHAD